MIAIDLYAAHVQERRGQAATFLSLLGSEPACRPTEKARNLLKPLGLP